MSDFIGANLRLIRLFHDLSLTELGERVAVSKQFLSRVETGAESGAAPLENSLAGELNVLPLAGFKRHRLEESGRQAVEFGFGCVVAYWAHIFLAPFLKITVLDAFEALTLYRQECHNVLARFTTKPFGEVTQ